MKTNNIIQEKSFAFAIRIVNLYKHLTSEKNEIVLSKQLLRCGTSIGANIDESRNGLSDKDFLNNLSICYKEARESIYWLKLLYKTNYFSYSVFESLLNDAEEICNILDKTQIAIKSSNAIS